MATVIPVPPWGPVDSDSEPASPQGSRGGRGGIAILLGPTLLVVFALLHDRIVPSAAITRPLKVDMLILALLGAAPLRIAAWRPVWGRGAFVGLTVSGALLGATMVSPWAALPWLMIPALAFFWVNRSRFGKRNRRTLALGVLLTAGLANLAALSVATAHGLRVQPEAFASQNFRVNGLLADVPLHDVWIIRPRVGEGLTMDEVIQAFRRSSLFHTTPALMGLAVLRGILGRVLQWDDPRWMVPDASFVGRLDEGDRLRSTTEPGTHLGPWRVVYAFPEEGLVELMNGTVHVAVSCTLGEEDSSPAIFLAFRVREVNWSTPFYMRMIDPFRRYLVYPPMIRQFAHTLGRR